MVRKHQRDHRLDHRRAANCDARVVAPADLDARRRLERRAQDDRPAGPVGLVVAALLQSNDRFSVHLYEKRRAYSRTRMVQLAPYLVADSIASYCTDYIDGESVEAIFEPSELGRASRFGKPFRRFCRVRDGYSC